MLNIDPITKGRVKKDKAKLPEMDVSDINIGKFATMASGMFAGLEGVVAPNPGGLHFEVLEDGSMVYTASAPDKPYLLLLYLDDGSLFCGAPINLTDVGSLSGGFNFGDGTLVHPYYSGGILAGLYGLSNTYNYHKIVNPVKGKLNIAMNTSSQGVGATFEVRSPTLNNAPIYTFTLDRTPKTVTFDYDPTVHGQMLQVVMTHEPYYNVGYTYTLSYPGGSSTTPPNGGSI